MSGPLVVSTWSFGQRSNAAAWQRLEQGASGIDAVEAGCSVVEADPEVDSVGFGGFPDSTGQMSLDASIMLSPARCGSVCGVRRHLQVTTLARAVMEQTSHVMLAGQAADDFADALGMPQQSLLAPAARAAWVEWLKSSGQSSPGRPVDQHHGRLFSGASEPPHDTIGVVCLDDSGRLAGACSTSGTPFKRPGRVSDSCIIGAGLYVEPEAGAAVATGEGELIIGACSSFHAVEMMRGGATPLEALRTVLQRIVNHNDLRETDQVAMIAMNPDGGWSAASLRSDYRTAVRSVDRDEVIDPDLVLLSDAAG